jgi:hypothetical protein|tara:strand:- start:582 stop:842 length:261 start_codon:yes stop_codon:yes gene_type:complete
VSGLYGLFGAWSEEAVEMRVGKLAESTVRGSAAPHHRRGVRNGDYAIGVMSGGRCGKNHQDSPIVFIGEDSASSKRIRQGLLDLAL